MGQTYTIGEVAKMMNVPSSTLRYYDKEGLLPFVDRTGGNIRVFKDADFEWLDLIECLKAAGMSLKEVRQFIEWFYEGDSTIEKRRQMFYDRKQIVEKELAQMQQTLDTLTFKCWFYDMACELGSTEPIINMEPADMPAHIRPLKEKMLAKHKALAAQHDKTA